MFMKKPVLIKKLRFPTYRVPIWVVVCNNVYHAIEALENESTQLYSWDKMGKVDVITWFHYTEKSCRATIIMKAKSKPGDIAHECLHAMNMMYAYVGAKHSLANDEPHCYMLGWTVDQVHKQINLFKKQNLK